MLRTYATGDVIAGKYHVRRVFGGAGASGMGVVYLVEERQAPFPFVLKACQHAEEPAKIRFQREAELWVSIGSHPNVTRALWVRHLDDQLFVAAEYVRGGEAGYGSLQAVLGADVAPVQLIRWAMQFCSGLGHALARGLIAHRDIKPDNLLLTSHGDLKVADFGLGQTSALTDAAVERAGPATHGTVATLPYMAPEQIQRVAVDHRVDLYAFGIVLYQLCSRGAYPYDIDPRQPERSFIEGHLHGTPRPIAHPLWPILSRCLARSPDDRWDDPRALASAVSGFAAQMNWRCPPLIAPQPPGLDDLYAEAQSLAALGKPERALESVDKYLEKAPQASWAWTEKGRILMGLHRDTEAENATRTSIALNSSNSHAWNNLGVILNRLGRYEDSCLAYEAAIECDPLNDGAMMNAAAPLCGIGRHDRAAELLCCALRLNPTKDILRFNGGNVVATMVQGRALGAAEKVALALVSVDAANSQAWHNLGVIAAARGEREAALQHLENAQRCEPNNADTLLLVARLQGELGRFDEGITHLNRLIATNQHLSKAVCFKAQFLAQNDAGKALGFLEEYLHRAPEDDSAWFILCNIAEAEQDMQKALTAARECERILRRRRARPDSEDATWIRRKIRELSAKTS